MSVPPARAGVVAVVASQQVLAYRAANGAWIQHSAAGIVNADIVAVLWMR